MKNISSPFFYALYATTIFLGAFLLFQVQPIIGKYILPWFGGTSAVWMTSLLFFQTVLLVGYLYAFLITKLQKRVQIFLHLFIVCLTVCVLLFPVHTWNSPITPGISDQLSDSFSPITQVLYILFISVGLPYFLLSTTSTLLQKWYSYVPTKKSPYSLYALSNTGSLLGILTYPFITEPLFSLHKQGNIWTATFFFFCMLLFFSSLAMLFKGGNNRQSHQIKQNKLYAHTKNHRLLWLFIPAVSSLMLLAGTNQLTQQIPPFPFLWLMPLALYLLSFILCFSESSFSRSTRNIFIYTFFVLIPIVFLLPLLSDILLILQLSFFAVLLFLCFMICHNELYRIKPTPDHLNEFYLMISLGSVIGASVVAIIAPLYFSGMYWEFYIGLFLCANIGIFALLHDKKSAMYRFLFSLNTSQKIINRGILLFLFWTFVVLTLAVFAAKTNKAFMTWRNFYGLLEVTREKTASGDMLCLVHGQIIHGCQFTAASLRMIPTTYYGEKSGIGLAIKTLREKQKNPLRIGILGLGIGGLTAYGQKGDQINYYEINPQVIDIAQHYFAYLSGSPANISIIQGDARLSLEKELRGKKSGNYNLLVVDVYNDDAIPTHLLTNEAFSIYRRHLAKTNSILAIHISTNYYDLSPVIVQQAKKDNLKLAIIQSAPDKKKMVNKSVWALLSDDKNVLTSPAIAKVSKDLSHVKQIPLWTDDYSNFVQILK